MEFYQVFVHVDPTVMAQPKAGLPVMLNGVNRDSVHIGGMMGVPSDVPADKLQNTIDKLFTRDYVMEVIIRRAPERY